MGGSELDGPLSLGQGPTLCRRTFVSVDRAISLLHAAAGAGSPNGTVNLDCYVRDWCSPP
jgi:hypothetical protein